MAPAVDSSRAGRCERGLTLVELVVGLGLLGFVTLSLVSLVMLALRLNDLSEERSIATSIAADRVQRIASSPYRAAADYLEYKLGEETSSGGPPQTFTTGYGQVPDHPDFRRIVELHYDTPSAGMLAIEARVSWRRADGTERTHTMATFVHPFLN